jgi:hypothetical protein
MVLPVNPTLDTSRLLRRHPKLWTTILGRTERPAENERAAEHCESAATIHGLPSPKENTATILRIRSDIIPDCERPLYESNALRLVLAVMHSARL